jgi:hypothetical protein
MARETAAVQLTAERTPEEVAGEQPPLRPVFH